MNKLLEELKEKREYHVARVKGLTEDIAVAQRMIVDEEEAIADLDKAIAALSTETEEGLLDPESPPVDDEVRNQAEGEAAFDPNATMYPSDYTTLPVNPVIPEGFTPWVDGGHIDLTDDAIVETMTRDGQRGVGSAGTFFWGSHFDFERHLDIIAYRIIADAERPSDESQATDQDREEPKQTESSSQASSTVSKYSDRFIPWSGGARPDDALAGATMVKFEDGSFFKEHKDHELNDACWTHADSQSAYNIIAYQVIETPADAERTKVDSPPTEQDRVEPLPSGIQFRIDGGPLQTTGQEPAAFALVNAIEDPDTDALMWANGFEADAKSKAEAEEPEVRRFDLSRLFGKKELA